MISQTPTHPLLKSRSFYRKLPADAPTTVIFFAQGGMGDRIVFQSIVADAIQRFPERTERIVVAIPHHNGEYDAHDYRPSPDEVWVVPRPRDVRPLLAALPGIVRALLPDAVSVHIEWCDDFDIRQPEDHETIEFKKFYRRITARAAEGHYPELPLYAPVQTLARRLLCEIGLFKKNGPLVAFHYRQFCDQSPGDTQKNLSFLDVIELLRLLCARLQAQIVLIAGKEEIPAELDQLISYRVSPDPTLSIPAAILRLCDLYIGSDSGPTHLAAAAGVSILCLRKTESDWIFGPFSPPEKLIQCGTFFLEHSLYAGLGFNPEEVFEIAQGILAPLRRCALALNNPITGPILPDHPDWQILHELSDFLARRGWGKVVISKANWPLAVGCYAAVQFFLERGVIVELVLGPNDLDAEFVSAFSVWSNQRQFRPLVAASSIAELTGVLGQLHLREFCQCITPCVELGGGEPEPGLVEQVRQLASLGLCLPLQVGAAKNSSAVDGAPTPPGQRLAAMVLEITSLCTQVHLKFILTGRLGPELFTDAELGRLVKNCFRGEVFQWCNYLDVLPDLTILVHAGPDAVQRVPLSALLRHIREPYLGLRREYGTTEVLMLVDQTCNKP
jgi:hypothetical protein